MLAPPRPYHLLIADDDPVMRETLVEMLRPEFETIDVESGEEAIEVVGQQEIHLVLFDLHMPRLTGIETLRVVKQMRSELPSILMSANWTEPLRAAALELHPSAVLQKPISRRELVGSVTTALQETYTDWPD